MKHFATNLLLFVFGIIKVCTILSLHYQSVSLLFFQSFDWSHVQNLASSGAEHSQSPVSTTLSPHSESGAQDMHDLAAQYEQGDKGSLHPVFASMLEPWLQFCCKKSQFPMLFSHHGFMISSFS
jgi:hypothetical protein